MVVNHPQEIKDENDLPYSSVDPPQIHQHFRLRTVPLKETKIKMKKIQMKKLKTLTGIKGFDYGLPSTTSSPSSHMSIKIQSVFGAYNENHTNEGEEYIEDIQNALEDVKPKVEGSIQDNNQRTDTRSQLFKDIESLVKARITSPSSRHT